MRVTRVEAPASMTERVLRLGGLRNHPEVTTGAGTVGGFGGGDGHGGIAMLDSKALDGHRKGD